IQSVCNAVFAIKAPISSTALSAMAKTIVTSGVEPASMLQVPLDDVDFLDGTADPAPDAVDELLAQVKTIYGPDGMPKDASWQGFAISPAGSTDELRSLHREQSERIVHDLDRPIQVQSLLNGDVTPWPVDCAAITLFARLMQQTPPPPPPALKARRTRGGGKGAERKEP
ncbi:MAG TPA: hypothetical protein VN783_11730, partial [Thermoanaerobaculia bacterium]|nr:hypothetical protein [Thermoanaerobaculia bacterium]